MTRHLEFPGDPTPLGWIVFALYAAAAILSIRTARICRGGDLPVFHRLWGLLGVSLLLLGVNKQLDLQTFLLEVARHLAIRFQVYEHRRAMQTGFFLCAVLAAVLVWVRWSVEARQFARRFPLAAIGSAMIAGYLALRAGTIDHIDELLGFRLDHVPGWWVLELAGLWLIIAQAVRFPSRHRWTS